MSWYRKAGRDYLAKQVSLVLFFNQGTILQTFVINRIIVISKYFFITLSVSRGRSLERHDKKLNLERIEKSSNRSPSPIRSSRHISSQDFKDQRFIQDVNDQGTYGDEQVEHVNLQNSVSNTYIKMI